VNASAVPDLSSSQFPQLPEDGCQSEGRTLKLEDLVLKGSLILHPLKMKMRTGQPEGQPLLSQP